jgi:transposase-like protein
LTYGKIIRVLTSRHDLLELSIVMLHKERWSIKNRSLFPNDEAVFKLLYRALKNMEKKWMMPIGD